MKSILISIRPEWTAKILNGIKTIEVRKTAPKCNLPIEVYIYCTKGNHIGHLSNRYVGKVVAKFTLREVEKCVNPMFPEGTFATKTVTYENLLDQSCLSAEQFDGYLGKGGRGYAWHISDLVIFDRPMELEQFEYPNPSGVRWVSQRSIKGLPNKKHPPQSWCYCEEKK